MKPLHTLEPLTSDSAAEPACSTEMQPVQAPTRHYAVRIHAHQLAWCLPVNFILEGAPASLPEAATQARGLFRF